MSEPESLQQVREGLRSFRKTTTQRQRQEADADARLKAGQKQADEALAHAKQKANTDLQQAQAEIATRYEVVTKQVNDLVNPDDEDGEALESRLAKVGLPMVFSLEGTWWQKDSAPEGTRIVKLPNADILQFGLRGIADPMQALTESSALVIKAFREVGNAVMDLQRWRETRERRRETIIVVLGVGLLLAFFVLAVVVINQPH